MNIRKVQNMNKKGEQIFWVYIYIYTHIYIYINTHINNIHIFISFKPVNTKNPIPSFDTAMINNFIAFNE